MTIRDVLRSWLVSKPTVADDTGEALPKYTEPAEEKLRNQITVALSSEDTMSKQESIKDPRRQTRSDISNGVKGAPKRPSLPFSPDPKLIAHLREAGSKKNK